MRSSVLRFFLIFFDAHRLDPFVIEVTIARATRKCLDEKPNETREWGATRRLGIPYRCNYAVKVEAYADNDVNQDDDKNGCVDLQDDVTKSPKEKYEREVDKSEYSLRQYW